MLTKTHLKQQKNHLDFQLLAVVCILSSFGLLMVYDASVVQALRDFKDGFYYIKQQFIWFALGFVSLIFFSFFDYKKFKKLAVWLLLLSLILLVAVFIPGLGVQVGGAYRWLRFGPITIQPAEIIKLTGILFLSTIFEKRARFIPLIILTGIVVIITAIFQKDLGSTIVFVLTSLCLYFVAGAPLWHFTLVLPFGLIAGIALILTSSYRLKRVLAFLDPFSDPQGITYHISQVLIALGAGGLFGLGFSHSRQKFEYIPEVSTDSIFAIIGEELGFAGGIFLIALFFLLLFRGLKIAQNCQDYYGKILATGLTFWLGIQVVINLSSMVALLPLTGVPLPFISYGGSALVVNLTAAGILLNISKSSSASN